MRRTILFSICLLLVSSCNRLDSILYQPKLIPESWLSIQPSVEVAWESRQFILVQPSSTIFVYLLGLVAIWTGIYFLRIQETHQSRKWWGIALLLWGLGALAAGTSYQAFSYEIKCRGQAFCSWTSWWEIAYLILSAASVDAMLIAGAYACCLGKSRKLMVSYAAVNAISYTLIVLIGALTLSKFLISFELLLLAAAPGILALFILNTTRYVKHRKGMDLALIGTWLWLGITLGAYFLTLMLDITPALWHRGVWFSENDVLHLGLITWIIYIGTCAARKIKDPSTLDAQKGIRQIK